MSDDRSAALVMRIWFEDGDQFRARVTAVGVGGEGADEDLTIAVASSPGDALDAVSEWLDEFVRDASNPG